MQRNNKRRKINTEIEIEKRIGEILREGEPSKRLNPEQLELWVAQDKEKKKRRFRRNLAIACCCVLVCGVSIYGVGRYMGVGPFVATAGEDDKGKVVNVDEISGSRDKEDSGDNNISSEVKSYKSWDLLSKAKKEYPDLAVPSYIPEEYEFCELTITEENNITYYLYRWISQEGEIKLRQHKVGQKAFTYSSRTIKTNKGNVYIQEKDQKMAMFLMYDYEFLFFGSCTDEEICKIVEGLDI